MLNSRLLDYTLKRKLRIMSVYTCIFGVLIAFMSYVLYKNYGNTFNGYASIVDVPDKRYDYIIVGAGTAGCVLAARLSQDPGTRVLLLEAGDQMSFLTNVPLTATAAQLGPNDWSLRTTPQKYSSFGLLNQTQLIPRGKGLGGSGQINFLMHGFGLPKDYKKWQELGLKSWGYDELKPYFLRAFGTTKSEFDSRSCHWHGNCLGSEAPMKLTQIDEKNVLMQVFRRASSESGGKRVVFRKPTATVTSGRRHSTLDAYLRPAMNRNNLHVLLKTSAVSIRFRNKMASSLYILQDGRHFNNIFVNKEIILSAGAIMTPHILMQSGYGPAKVLQENKITPVVVNEHVGQNLHDHMNMPIYVSIEKPISVNLAKIFTFTTLWNYLWRNEGLLSFPPLAGIEYLDSAALMLFAMGTTSEKLLREISNYKSEVFRSTFPYHNASGDREGFMFLSTCASPHSRGSVTSRAAQPRLDTNYLHSDHDLRCIITAIRRAERLVSSGPFRDIGARLHWPRPERCAHLRTDTYSDALPINRIKQKSRREANGNQWSPSDLYLGCIIREVAVTGHHIGGTCAGGSVVNEQFQLKSVSGLRVVDGSVLPTPLSLYPNSVIVALAERAADLIRRAY